MGFYLLLLGKGCINYTCSIKLPFILYFPPFSHRLLSISAFIRYLNCKIKFFTSHYTIQELSTEKIIGYGSGRIHNSLYQSIERPLLKCHALLGESDFAHHQITVV